MPGGAIPADIGPRLDAASRILAGVRKSVDQLSSRDAARDLPRHVWLAKTASLLGAYPSDGDTFPIVFLDGSYTRTAGSPVATYTARSSTALEYAKSIAGAWYPEGTVLAVMEEDRQYWIIDSLALEYCCETIVCDVLLTPERMVDTICTATLCYLVPKNLDWSQFKQQSNCIVCSCGEQCSNCLNGVAPATLSLTFAGFENGGDCGECAAGDDSLNTTFQVPWYVAEGQCKWWSYTEDDPQPCRNLLGTYDHAAREITITLAPDLDEWLLEVKIGLFRWQTGAPGDSEIHYFRKWFESLPDCQSWSGVELDWDETERSSLYEYCVADAGTTATISAA